MDNQMSPISIQPTQGQGPAMTITLEQVQDARRSIAGRLHSNMLVGRDAQIAEISEYLKRTILHGESNSVLLVGPRGSGKTAALTRALEETRKTLKRDFCECLLDGRIHSTERLALKQVAKDLQVGLDDDAQSAYSTVAQAFQYIISVLRDRQSARPIIIAMNEFDMFARIERQNLLYTLFDAAKNGSHPILVVGVTARLNCEEALEKRVRSRFSHRHVYFQPVASVNCFFEISRSLLTLPERSSYEKQFNERLHAALEDGRVERALEALFERSRDVRCLIKCLIQVTGRLSLADPFVTEESIEHAASGGSAGVPSLLMSLSVTEIAVLVCVKKLLARSVESFNFEAIDEEYRGLLKMGDIDNYVLQPRPVLFQAFERLVSLEVLCYSENSGRLPPRFRGVELSILQEDLLQAIQQHPLCPTALRRSLRK